MLRKNTLLVLFLSFFLAFFLAGPSLAAENTAIGTDTFEEILDYVQTLHISSPDSDTLVRGAIEGLLDSLKDPYTEYLPPAELEDFSGSLDGDYVGVGLHLQPGERYPKVLDAIERSPASEAGIKPGDLVIKVDGVDISQESLGKVVQKIRGPEGTKVHLTIRREGAADLELELARANINTPTVNGKIMDDGIGYIRINTFGVHTAGEFKKSLDSLIQQGAKKLILDLSDNPGGILQAAVRISGNFIESGQVAVSTVDRSGKRLEYRTEEAPIAKGLPVVVLVNHDSASASEILAGALQDFGVATLIGGQTYGKGTVQAVIPLEAGGALKLTIAKYHTPKDRVIDGTGLSPDIQVLTPGLSVAVAQRYLTQTGKNTVVIDADKPDAWVNGSAVQLRQPAVQRLGATNLPLRFVFEALGCRVDWLAYDESIKITGSKSEIVYYPGDGRFTLGGQNVPGAEPLLYEDGNAYIPVSDLSLLNINVKLDGSNISIEK